MTKLYRAILIICLVAGYGVMGMSEEAYAKEWQFTMYGGIRGDYQLVEFYLDEPHEASTLSIKPLMWNEPGLRWERRNPGDLTVTVGGEGEGAGGTDEKVYEVSQEWWEVEVPSEAVKVVINCKDCEEHPVSWSFDPTVELGGRLFEYTN